QRGGPDWVYLGNDSGPAQQSKIARTPDRLAFCSLDYYLDTQVSLGAAGRFATDANLGASPVDLREPNHYGSFACAAIVDRFRFQLRFAGDPVTDSRSRRGNAGCSRGRSMRRLDDT